jgi:WD40 repeat protein
VKPEVIDNYLFSTYFSNGKKVYNLRGTDMSSSGNVKTFKINPSGSSYAVIDDKKGNAGVIIYDLWKDGKQIDKIFSDKHSAVSLCYSPDSKYLAVAYNDNTVSLLDCHVYSIVKQLTLPAVASAIEISGNDYYLSAIEGNKLSVVNIETGEVRKELDYAAKVNDVKFDADDRVMAVLTSDGKLTTYDTRTFAQIKEYTGMGDALHLYYHPDGKYLAVVTGAKRVAVVNTLDPKERIYYDYNEGGISDTRFMKDGKKRTFLAYNTANSIVYQMMNKLSPYYSKLLADELNEKMNVWMKQMDGESLADYKKRVNDKTRKEKMLLYSQEIATRMAENLLSTSTVTLGNYNPKNGLLAMDFNTMPSIYLKVPQKEAASLMNVDNLEFRNAKYCVNQDDRFELVYLDVYNKKTKKTYTFNNLKQQSLAYLRSDDSFVPLDLVEKSSMDEITLRSITKRIIKAAKQKNTISDNTNITVNANVVSDVDANGKKVMNYRIGFTYKVKKNYSNIEDFGPGKYEVEQSGAAMSMLAIMKTAFESDFKQYIKKGKKLRVKITGNADAIPITGKIEYNGCYGNFNNEPAYKDDELSNISVSKDGGITTNEQLAFLRAFGVKQYIVNHIPSMQKMDSDYKYCISIADKAGGEFRRISVEFTFFDAF